MTNASALLENTQNGAPTSAERYGEVYNYSGQFDGEFKPDQSRLELLTKTRLESLEARQSEYVGMTSSPFLGTGTKFTLTNNHGDETRNKKYIVKAVKHTFVAGAESNAEQEDYYVNEITVLEDGCLYRPKIKTPRPRMNSVHSAVVTGPAGEEIWTDVLGRIKIQFPWDRVGGKNERSSCWVRVMQGWGGNNWGALYTPRVGMEVLVSFVEGDINRPIVTGSLYNSDHIPPYLPERNTKKMMPTKSTLKSNSSKGGDGFNEFRFEDLKGEEQIYTRAEKDDDKYVRSNKTLHVESGSSWESIEKGDRDVALYGDANAEAKDSPEGQDLPAGAGDDFLEISSGNRSVSFLAKNGAVQDSLHIVEGDRTEQIDKGNFIRASKEGDLNEYLKQGDHNLLIDEGSKSETLKSGDSIVGLEDGSYGLHLKNGDYIASLDSGKHLTELKNGDHKTLIKSGDFGLQLKSGAMGVTLDSGDQTTHIKSGDQILKLDSGNKDETIGGDSTQTISGDQTTQVNGSQTLTILGDLEIVVLGNISITSAGDINMAAAGNIAMEAAGTISTTSVGNMSMTSIEAMEMTSVGNMSITSIEGMELTSISDLALTTPTVCTITGLMGIIGDAPAGLVDFTSLGFIAEGQAATLIDGGVTAVNGKAAAGIAAPAILIGI